MENWKSKIIIFYIVCAILIGYPFFAISYFETHTAILYASKYFLLPIFIILLIFGPKFYMKKVKPLNHSYRINEKVADIFTISFMIICATGLFWSIAFSLIITTNQIFANSNIVKIKEPVLNYEPYITKHGRLRHYIKILNPKTKEIIKLEVYKQYQVGDLFEKEMKYGAWGILYLTD